jgi:hypothetical protein
MIMRKISLALCLSVTSLLSACPEMAETPTDQETIEVTPITEVMIGINEAHEDTPVKSCWHPTECEAKATALRAQLDEMIAYCAAKHLSLDRISLSCQEDPTVVDQQ